MRYFVVAFRYQGELSVSLAYTESAEKAIELFIRDMYKGDKSRTDFTNMWSLDDLWAVPFDLPDVDKIVELHEE